MERSVPITMGREVAYNREAGVNVFTKISLNTAPLSTTELRKSFLDSVVDCCSVFLCVREVIKNEKI